MSYVAVVILSRSLSYMFYNQYSLITETSEQKLALQITHNPELSGEIVLFNTGMFQIKEPSNKTKMGKNQKQCTPYCALSSN